MKDFHLTNDIQANFGIFFVDFFRIEAKKFFLYQERKNRRRKYWKFEKKIKNDLLVLWGYLKRWENKKNINLDFIYSKVLL